MHITIGQTGNFSLTQAVQKGFGSCSFSSSFACTLVPFSKIVNTTLFIPQNLILICSDHYNMRNNHLMNNIKPQGFIVRRSEQKLGEGSPKSVSVERQLSPYITITTNSSFKIPGQIRRIIKENSNKIDQQVFINEDVYENCTKLEEAVNYQSAEETLLPLKKQNIQAQMSPSTNKNNNHQNTQISYQELQQMKLLNIHGDFDLQAFRQLGQLLKNIINSLNINESELIHQIHQYIKFVKAHNIDNLSQIKQTYTKKDLLKQAFIKQRQAILMICLSLVTRKLYTTKKSCLNLLKYALENHIVCLIILAENPQFKQKLLKQQKKEYLTGKSFEFLRSTIESMNELIINITKIDPLFSEEYNKVKNKNISQSVKSLLSALLSFFAFYIHAIHAQHVIPFLTTAPVPFIHESPQRDYTLVIDFMRVFVDQSTFQKKSSRFKQQLPVRPYSCHFLKQMSKYYQIISFSDSMPIECNKVINKIDFLKIVKHKLYKFHIDPTNNKKQMKKIGRNLDKLILLDTIHDPQDHNLLPISAWKGDPDNVQLAQLCPLLAMIAVKQLQAIPSIKKIRQAAMINNSLGLKYINCGLNL